MKKTNICKDCGEEKLLSEFSKNPTNRCKPCHAKWTREYRKTHPLPADQREANILRCRSYRAKYPTRARERWLKGTYGITTDDYNDMFVEQNGCCAICGVHQSEMKRTFSVDHNHTTGQTRALLCDRCNTALGLLKEDRNIVLSLLEYLDSYEDEGSLAAAL